MAHTKNKIGNIIAFIISLAVHLGAIYLVYFVAAKDETLFATKKEAEKMMAISLNQISPTINTQNQNQATQEQSAQPITPPEPTPKPPKDEPKEEPKLVEKPIEKKVQKPKPKPKEKPKVVERVPEPPKQEPKEEIKEVVKEDKEQTTPATPPSPPPSSQNIANNEAVSQGGAPVSGQSTSSDSAQARTILGEIHAAILKHKTYPKRAINSRMEGRAKVSFLLTAQCEFSKLEIVKSSGHEFLDRHALHTIKRSCKDFPSEAVGMDLSVIVAFNLRDLES